MQRYTGTNVKMRIGSQEGQTVWCKEAGDEGKICTSGSVGCKNV